MRPFFTAAGEEGQEKKGEEATVINELPSDTPAACMAVDIMKLGYKNTIKPRILLIHKDGLLFLSTSPPPCEHDEGVSKVDGRSSFLDYRVRRFIPLCAIDALTLYARGTVLRIQVMREHDVVIWRSEKTTICRELKNAGLGILTVANRIIELYASVSLSSLVLHSVEDLTLPTSLQLSKNDIGRMFLLAESYAPLQSRFVRRRHTARIMKIVACEHRKECDGTECIDLRRCAEMWGGGGGDEEDGLGVEVGVVVKLFSWNAVKVTRSFCTITCRGQSPHSDALLSFVQDYPVVVMMEKVRMVSMATSIVSRWPPTDDVVKMRRSKHDREDQKDILDARHDVVYDATPIAGTRSLLLTKHDVVLFHDEAGDAQRSGALVYSLYSLARMGVELPCHGEDAGGGKLTMIFEGRAGGQDMPTRATTLPAGEKEEEEEEEEEGERIQQTTIVMEFPTPPSRVDRCEGDYREQLCTAGMIANAILVLLGCDGIDVPVLVRSPSSSSSSFETRFSLAENEEDEGDEDTVHVLEKKHRRSFPDFVREPRDYRRPVGVIPRRFASDKTLLARQVLRLTARRVWKTCLLVVTPNILFVCDTTTLVRRRILFSTLMGMKLLLHHSEGPLLLMCIYGEHDLVLKQHSTTPSWLPLNTVADVIVGEHPMIFLDEVSLAGARGKLKNLLRRRLLRPPRRCASVPKHKMWFHAYLSNASMEMFYDALRQERKRMHPKEGAQQIDTSSPLISSCERISEGSISDPRVLHLIEKLMTESLVGLWRGTIFVNFKLKEEQEGVHPTQHQRRMGLDEEADYQNGVMSFTRELQSRLLTPVCMDMTENSVLHVCDGVVCEGQAQTISTNTSGGGELRGVQATLRMQEKQPYNTVAVEQDGVHALFRYLPNTNLGSFARTELLNAGLFPSGVDLLATERRDILVPGRGTAMNKKHQSFSLFPFHLRSRFFSLEDLTPMTTAPAKFISSSPSTPLLFPYRIADDVALWAHEVPNPLFLMNIGPTWTMVRFQCNDDAMICVGNAAFVRHVHRTMRSVTFYHTEDERNTVTCFFYPVNQNGNASWSEDKNNPAPCWGKTTHVRRLLQDVLLVPFSSFLLQDDFHGIFHYGAIRLLNDTVFCRVGRYRWFEIPLPLLIKDWGGGSGVEKMTRFCQCSC
ncbi:hypothetical protein TcCL_ESM01413 [Trypanosoma cruzi]|uniref:Uncharacterized protein n=1 Tax=Trypanosoma cruzi (strain CL Brener) TaxID=353153 RepID=Q4DEJ7_TRYCC|nr:hypothetical protein Tc00.1047053503899.100 [Trypanosoma cruzi]EAN90954.1 hypothetical protein Tc00.1047053503899.100 [Trypanosoma cruzi]RNC60951.1 hypothetical protein TcCL_ESM01413 [Trypanosoma cruzi]|eukprot:XP_812805.1 hypothetical protein [Trypanosoma cruzi strain CL Brener]